MEDRIAWLAAVVIFLGIISLHDAHASPAVPATAMERRCETLSRYALVARSLAEAEVSKQTARRILARMYRTDERGQQLAARVLDYAYSDKTFSDKTFAAVFASQLEEACLGHRGRIAPYEALDGTGPRPKRFFVM